MILCLNVSATPLQHVFQITESGPQQYNKCLPFSWTTLRGKHCRHPITVMGVVDTFGL